MFLETFDAARSADALPLSQRRALNGGYVFISQNEKVAFLAEACIDVLRSANRLTGEADYYWSHICDPVDLGETKTPVCGPDQTLVLIGGAETPWRPNDDALPVLRSAIRNAARVCVVGAAVFVPLFAGVLSAKRLAVHPAFREGVQESLSNPEIVETPLHHHKALSSATGHVAAIRMMVDLIGAREGAYTRNALAKELGLEEDETVPNAGEVWRFQRMAQGDQVISQALEIMHSHLEDTLSVGQIADLLDVSPRKLERGFGDRLGLTPLKVYRELRLERVRNLLTQTSLSFGEISVACGFSNVTLMKKWFQAKYSETPIETRRRAYAGTKSAA